MCPVVVSEDTAGSTRIPALCCGLFGFDPARNTYPGNGNPGMTYTKDTLGVVARSVGDLLFYDRALLQDSHQADLLHQTAADEALRRDAGSIRVALPGDPWIREPAVIDPEGVEHPGFQCDQQMLSVYEKVQAALEAGGVRVVHEGWAYNAGKDRNPAADANGVKPFSRHFYSQTKVGYRASTEFARVSGGSTK